MSKKERLTLLGLMLSVFLIFYFFGTWDFHNELIRDRRNQEFVAYIDENWYTGTVTVDLPAEYQNEIEDKLIEEEASYMQEHITVEIANGQWARLAIYADYVYIENLYEKRNCITGKLLKTSSEFYYKQVGPYYVLPIYHPNTVQKRILAHEVKPNDYL